MFDLKRLPGKHVKIKNKQKKIFTEQNLLNLRKTENLTCEPEPTPSLPSLIPAELKVHSGKYRQGHRDATAPGSQSKATMSP